MFFPPLIEMIAFGYALDTDVKHMAMVDPERGSHGGEPPVHRSFRQHGDVSGCRRSGQTSTQLASEIRKGHAYVGLQIPPHFTRDLRAGHPAQVQVLIDGSNSTIALQALNTALADRADAIHGDR